MPKGVRDTTARIMGIQNRETRSMEAFIQTDSKRTANTDYSNQEQYRPIRARIISEMDYQRLKRDAETATKMKVKETLKRSLGDGNVTTGTNTKRKTTGKRKAKTPTTGNRRTNNTGRSIQASGTKNSTRA